MATTQAQLAERTAKLLLDDNWDGNVPLDVSKFQGTVGLRFVEVTQLADARLGELELDAASKNGTARVRSGLSPVHHRWVQAHQLGHWLIHTLTAVSPTKVQKPEDFSSSVKGSSKLANEVAAALLVPLCALKDAVQEHGKNLDALSAHFGVPKLAVEKRLKALNSLAR